MDVQFASCVYWERREVWLKATSVCKIISKYVTYTHEILSLANIFLKNVTVSKLFSEGLKKFRNDPFRTYAKLSEKLSFLSA